MLQVLVIDRQPIYSNGLASLTKSILGDANVLEVTNHRKVISLVRGSEIDLVILDVFLEGGDGIRLAKSILSLNFKGKIIFISSKDSSSLSKTAQKIGAHGFLSKTESSRTIANAISSIMNGYRMFKSIGSSSNGDVKLSSQEAIVFNYLIQGFSNKKISELLSLNAKTISTYKARILKKYQANSFVELISNDYMSISNDNMK